MQEQFGQSRYLVPSKPGGRPNTYMSLYAQDIQDAVRTYKSLGAERWSKFRAIFPKLRSMLTSFQVGVKDVSPTFTIISTH